MTVNQYKLELKEKEQKDKINKQIKAQEEKIAKRKKKTIGWGIAGIGAVAAIGLGIAGFGIAAGVVAVGTVAALGIRALVNSFKKDTHIFAPTSSCFIKRCLPDSSIVQVEYLPIS